MNTETLISVCAVVRNDRDLIGGFLEKTTQVLSAHYAYYELLIVDNNSSDNTAELIQAAQKTTGNIRLVRLSRLYKYDTATTAALDNSIGDVVIILDPRDDPPALIPRLVEKAAAGFDIVVVKSDARQSYTLIDRFAASFLYALASKILRHPIEIDDTHFRLFSRRVVNSLTQIRSKRRYLKYFNALVGFKSTHIVYQDYYPDRLPRRKIKRLERTGSLFDLIISNSALPLRFASLLGVLASFFNLLYLGYIFAVTVIREGQLAEGWLTTSLTSTSMFLILFIILSILAEYIARLLEETKDEPLYFIEYETHSTVSSYSRVMTDEKLNVVQ